MKGKQNSGLVESAFYFASSILAINGRPVVAVNRMPEKGASLGNVARRWKDPIRNGGAELQLPPKFSIIISSSSF
jgi:hypothetical protein